MVILFALIISHLTPAGKRGKLCTMKKANYIHPPFRTALLTLGLCAALPLAATALTVNNLSDGSLSGNTLTVSADVSGITASANASLWIVMAEPKDGDPAALTANMVSANTIPYTADGPVTLTAHVVLGTKVAFKIVVTEGNDTAETGVKTIVAPDGTKYAWNGPEGGYGLWSDPNNWAQGTDNGNRLGYPAYGSGFTFYKDYVMTARVDAAYNSDVFFQQIQNGSCFGWDNRQLVLVGITDDAEINIGGKTEHYPYSLILDNIKVAVSEVNVNAGGHLKLLNGSSLTINWWLGLQKDNAYCYVGPGCSITTTDWWEGTRIGGQNTLLEIDGGVVRTQRVLFGRDSSASVPSGIRFLGATSRLFVDERMDIVRDDYSSSPVIEYVVPLGGYAEAPLQKSGNGNIPFAGSQDTANGKPIQFAINEFSPYFSGSQAQDIPLLDWSNNGGSSAGIDLDTTDGCGISFAEFEDSDHNNFYTDSNVDGVAATRVWAHLTGTSEPASKTLVNSTVSGSVSDVTLTVSTSLFDYDGGNGTSTATLYVGYAGPNGDPTANMAVVDEAEITGNTGISLSATVIAGSQTAYAVIVENTQGQWHFTSSTATNIVQVRDTSTYRWVPNNSGLWSDPMNWTVTAGGNYESLGYPSYGSNFRFSGNQTAVVQVDAAYTSLGTGNVSGSSNLDVTFLGTVEGAAILGGWNFGNSDPQTITFDGVETKGGTLSLGNNCRLNLRNGAKMVMSWRFHVEGENSTLYVGKDSLMRISNAEPYHWISLDRTGSSIIIEDGTIETLDLAIGATHTDETPNGIFFLGTHPSLVFYGSYSRGQRIQNAIPGHPLFSFSVPEGGYEQAPIRGTGTHVAFLEQTSSDIPTAIFQVDRHSPFLNESRAAEVQLVSWNSNGINTNGIKFDDNLDISSCRFYYTPDDSATKTGLYAHLHGHGHTVILFR